MNKASGELSKPAQWASVPWREVSTTHDSSHCQLISPLLMTERGITAKRCCELQSYRKGFKIKSNEKNRFVMTARHLFLCVVWVSWSVCYLCSVTSSVSVASAYAAGTLSMAKQAASERSNLRFTSGFGPISLPFFRGTPAQHTPRKDFCHRNRAQGAIKLLPLSGQ